MSKNVSVACCRSRRGAPTAISGRVLAPIVDQAVARLRTRVILVGDLDVHGPAAPFLPSLELAPMFMSPGLFLTLLDGLSDVTWMDAYLLSDCAELGQASSSRSPVELLPRATALLRCEDGDVIAAYSLRPSVIDVMVPLLPPGVRTTEPFAAETFVY